MRRSTLGFVALGLFLFGPTLAWLRILPPIGGFVVMALGGLIALSVAIATIIQALRGRGVTAGGAIALVVGAIFVFAASRGAGVPRINDFTTDVTDPPAFKHAASVPKNAGRDMTYPPAFATQQRTCCADLAPVKIAVPPGVAFERAQQVAQRMPTWTVTAADPQAGTFEAVSESALFHFQDDVVIRVRPDGDGSRVDIRSKSRDGQGDFGVNAARIRAYTAALAAAK